MVKLPTIDNVRSIDARVTRDPGVESTADEFGAGIFEATGKLGVAGERFFGGLAKEELKKEAKAEEAKKAQAAKNEKDAKKKEAAGKVQAGNEAEERVARSIAATRGALESSKVLDQVGQEAGLTNPDFERLLFERFGGVVDNVTNDVASSFNIAPETLPEIRAVAQQNQAPVFRRGQIRAHNARVSRLKSEMDQQVGQIATGVRQGSLPIDEGIIRTDALFDSMADVLPDMDVEFAKDGARRQLLTGFVDGLVDQNPAAAVKFFDETPRDQLLDGLGFAAADIDAFRADAVAEAGRRETAGRAEASRLMQTELKRMEPGRFLDVGQIGDGVALENRIDALMGPEAAEAFREVRARADNVRRRVEELALLPEGEIATRLDAMGGTLDPEGAGRNAETVAAVTDGAAKMRAARADDPAGFFAPLTERALDPLKRVPGFVDENADPARLAVSLRLQAASGVAQPRVLARAEAGELAAGLDALKPSERPEQIRTLEARFGDGFAAARAELAANGGAMTGALTRVASTREIGKGGVSGGGASRGGVSRGVGANVSPADPATAGQITAVQEIGPAEIGKSTPPEDSTAIDGHLTVATSEDGTGGSADLTQEAMVVPVPGRTSPGRGPIPPGPMPPEATNELNQLFKEFGNSIGRILGIPSAAPDDDDDEEQQNLPAKPGETTPAQPPEEEPPVPPRPPGPDLPLPDIGGDRDRDRERGPKPDVRLQPNVGKGEAKEPTQDAMDRWWQEEGKSLDTERKQNPNRRIAPSESFIWRNLKQFKAKEGIKTNGLQGKKARFFKYDRGGKGRHKSEIEVFDRNKNHLGTIDSLTGKMIKGPDSSKTIDLSAIQDGKDTAFV